MPKFIIVQNDVAAFCEDRDLSGNSAESPAADLISIYFLQM
jgi:hypothetical protein